MPNRKSQPIRPVGPVRLTPTRSPGSSQLDGAALPGRRKGEVHAVPVYRDWRSTMSYLRSHWRPGQHMALVARTRSGKTTAARRMLALRDWVVVFGTKPRDPDLYDALERQGYVVKEHWSPDDTEHNRVILKPPFDPEDINKQRAVFRRALLDVFRTGGWCLYFDEVLYLSRELKLADTLNLLWLQGGAMGITLVAGTQRPRSVPLNMFEQSSYVCAWRISDREDRYRAAEYTGPLQAQTFEVLSRLPRFEFLLVDLLEDESFRTKVT